MITTQRRVPTEKFEAATGWQLKPEGACKGEMCVPLPPGATDDNGGGTVAIATVAGRLGMPIVHDQARNVYAIGPEALAGHALCTAVAPELVLPDLDGNEFRLSSLRDQKVFIVAWAPY